MESGHRVTDPAARRSLMGRAAKQRGSEHGVTGPMARSLASLLGRGLAGHVDLSSVRVCGHGTYAPSGAAPEQRPDAHAT